ncbi:MAG: hypothetical protein JNM39_08765 [Bdellovibrionaceae bacterium]|nr:hypothetical protein [Pseudobdellovibrionaceae bacterium]
MSDSNKSEPKKLDKQIPNNVISISSGLCKADGCRSKALRAEFCDTHFTWFKDGLINKNGQKVPDFDKKHYAWEASHTAANKKKTA